MELRTVPRVAKAALYDDHQGEAFRRLRPSRPRWWTPYKPTNHKPSTPKSTFFVFFMTFF
jgi:hypothetical protein